MIAAEGAVQRPPDAKLLVVDSERNLIHVPRSALVEFLRPNDVVIANDAATLPASLSGVHRTHGEVDRSASCGQAVVESDGCQTFQRCCFW